MLAGAAQLTDAVALPAVAATLPGALGADGCELAAVTSSRYIHVSSGGLDPSSWTLNHSWTDCPAYGLRLNVAWVQVWELELDLKTCASVAPEVLRICASCQSKTQPEPEQIESEVAGQYQKLSVVVPDDGTAIVSLRELSPSGSVPGWTVPIRAEAVPLCALVVVTAGGGEPLGVHGVRPFSNPPLMTRDALLDGVTAFDCADSGPLPIPFEAVTVKVYVAPLLSPPTTVLVGAGLPVTVTGVWAVLPI